MFPLLVGGVRAWLALLWLFTLPLQPIECPLDRCPANLGLAQECQASDGVRLHAPYFRVWRGDADARGGGASDLCPTISGSLLRLRHDYVFVKLHNTTALLFRCPPDDSAAEDVNF
ncbi:hypothetical protein HOY80DRAFT_1024079 [Tuber brumale]|nr:hypothetical protein HOY80DRAFT_1024079 [Tuber brumale]